MGFFLPGLLNSFLGLLGLFKNSTPFLPPFSQKNCLFPEASQDLIVRALV